MMMMKSLVVKFLCFVILLSFVACEKSEEIGQKQKAKEIEAAEDDDKLPNLWDDEVVKRMVREILARDLAKENNQNVLRSRHRRDVSTTATSEAARKVPQTTRKSSATPKSSRKPVRQTQSNKNKNRVTQSSIVSTTRATVKPSTKPSTTIVTSTTFGTNSALKAKVRSLLSIHSV
jgi:hypothetical protein